MNLLKSNPVLRHYTVGMKGIGMQDSTWALLHLFFYLHAFSHEWRGSHG